MTVNIGDVVRANVIGTITNGSRFVNVFHTINSSTSLAYGDIPFATAVETVLLAGWARIKGNVAPQVHVDTVEFYNVTQDRPMLTVGANSAWNSGLGSSENTPPQVSYLATWKVGVKRVTAKKFIPGLMESMNNAGLINPAALSALTLYAAEYVGMKSVVVSGATVLLHLGVYAKEVQGTRAFYPFLTSIANSLAATQRRRKQSVGF